MKLLCLSAVMIVVILFTNNFIMTWLDSWCCEKKRSRKDKREI